MNKTLPFKALRRGTIFILNNEDDGREYVKLGQHGARRVIEGRIQDDEHCIPMLNDRCCIRGHINDK